MKKKEKEYANPFFKYGMIIAMLFVTIFISIMIFSVVAEKRIENADKNNVKTEEVKRDAISSSAEKELNENAEKFEDVESKKSNVSRKNVISEEESQKLILDTSDTYKKFGRGQVDESFDYFQNTYNIPESDVNLLKQMADEMTESVVDYEPTNTKMLGEGMYCIVFKDGEMAKVSTDGTQKNFREIKIPAVYNISNEDNAWIHDPLAQTIYTYNILIARYGSIENGFEFYKDTNYF